MHPMPAACVPNSVVLSPFASLTNVRTSAYIADTYRERGGGGRVREEARKTAPGDTLTHTYSLQSTRKNWRRVEKIKAVQLSMTESLRVSQVVAGQGRRKEARVEGGEGGWSRFSNAGTRLLVERQEPCVICQSTP